MDVGTGRKKVHDLYLEENKVKIKIKIIYLSLRSYNYPRSWTLRHRVNFTSILFYKKLHS